MNRLSRPTRVDGKEYTQLWKLLLFAIVAIVVVVMVFVGLWAGIKSIKRTQQRADAHNGARVAQLKVAKIKAEANQRRQEAYGLRDAQKTIDASLTPTYLQYEAIKAQLAMANGKNHTVVYIPTGKLGVPLTGTIDAQQGG